MRKKNLLAALLLLVAGMQTAWGQGFRVYKSDGTIAQFSLRTDSIVFYDGIGTDEDFGPFTPVNQPIVGTWYESKRESVTFREDGTTDYMEGATYEFMPYQGNIIINNASGVPMNILRVYKVTDEMLVVSTLGSSSFNVWSRTKPVQLVTGITLSETSIRLKVDELKRLTATVEPADADNPAVTWESSDDGVAEVNQSGRVTANAKGTCIITCAATDGSGVKAECQVRVVKDNSGTINGREYVDLDLPSGTLWATCNVGANSPEEYGDYFAWGETAPKDEYNWSTYKWCNGSYVTMTKYCTHSEYGYNGFTDGKTELDPEDDAATANWGSSWRMPSMNQTQELCNSNYTTSEWTTQNGVNGRKITSKSNGNSIFLPAAGYRHDDEPGYAGSTGLYWSSSLYPRDDYGAYGLLFGSDYWNWDYYNGYRNYGRSVRAVRVQN
ncbi:MAG: Ig-like domain-containing protein [Bacteroidaceae bacterium]|nr:Ig-like domain-containing protein [Bacteroidaceae bacterium]